VNRLLRYLAAALVGLMTGLLFFGFFRLVMWLMVKR